jgi:CubicO group peptidase (beta-lactamase class C family)
MAGGQEKDLAARVLNDPAGPIDDTYPAPRDITIEDLLTHRSGLAEGCTSRGAGSPVPAPI